MNDYESQAHRYVTSEDRRRYKHRGAKYGRHAVFTCVKCGDDVSAPLPMDSRAFAALSLGLNAASECLAAEGVDADIA